MVIPLTSSGCSKDFLGGFGIGGPKLGSKLISGFLGIATEKDKYSLGERINITGASDRLRANEAPEIEAQLIEDCNLRLVLSIDAQGEEERCDNVRIELNGKDITSFCSPQPLTIHSAYNEITCNLEEADTSGFGKLSACGSEEGFVYGSSPDPNRLDYVPGEVIVKLKDSVGIEMRTISGQTSLSTNNPQLQALLTKYKATNVEDVFDGLFASSQDKADMPDELKGIKKITIEAEGSVIEAVRSLSTLPDIEFAEPNYLLYSTYVPNDPHFWDQWAHLRTEAPLAWEIEMGDPNVVIAIIDSGVAYNHEDLKANMLADCTGGCPEGTGYDFVDIHTFIYKLVGYVLPKGEDYTSPDNNPTDFRDHGTVSAGIAAAVGNNEEGVIGVCPRCSIMPVRGSFTVIGKKGLASSMGQADDWAKGIVYAANNKADVLSTSSGESRNSNTVKRAVNYACKMGSVFVAAAGNENREVRIYPAAYAGVIAVAATNSDDTKTDFSNYGPWVDVAAPGDTIWSTTLTRPGEAYSSAYDTFSGTSASSPYISGTAALILSHYPGLGNVEVMRMIRRGVDEIEDKSIGTGRINVFKALKVRPESKVVNTGDLDINGYLSIWIEKYSGEDTAYNPDARQDHGVKGSEWRAYYSVVKKEAVKIEKGATLSLDQYFNPKKISLTEPGRYRVFAGVTDKREVTIATVSRPLAWSWEFWVE